MTVMLHARRARARLAIQAPDDDRFAGLGRVVARVVPAMRAMPEVAAGRCTLFALAGALLLASSAHGSRALAAVPLGAVVGWRGGVAVWERAGRAQADDVRRTLPVVLDRLTTCVLAGMSVERALRVVAPGTPGVLGDAFVAGLRAIDAGVSRGRAYDVIAARAGADEVRSMMATLARAERFGTSVSTALVAYARELRARARAAAEAEARTAPVKLIFPLVFCFLPAFVMLTIAPIAVSAVRTLGGL